MRDHRAKSNESVFFLFHFLAYLDDGGGGRYTTPQEGKIHGVDAFIDALAYGQFPHVRAMF